MSKKFKEYGKTIREIRHKRGLTQVQLAEKIGVHSQFVSNCERKLSALPKPETKMLVSNLKLTRKERMQILDALIRDAGADVVNAWAGPLKLRGL